MSTPLGRTLQSRRTRLQGRTRQNMLYYYIISIRWQQCRILGTRPCMQKALRMRQFVYRKPCVLKRLVWTLLRYRPHRYFTPQLVGTCVEATTGAGKRATMGIQGLHSFCVDCALICQGAFGCDGVICRKMSHTYVPVNGYLIPVD